MSGTNGYQSTKLNKNRDVRKRSGIKTDLTGMQHPGAAGQQVPMRHKDRGAELQVPM